MKLDTFQVQFSESVDKFCKNDAVVETVAVGLTIYGWAQYTYAAGKATRVWWETDEMIAPLIWLLGEITWSALILCYRSCWQYFATGKAQAHWTFVNAVVDDGLGLYGPSPMGDALVKWGRTVLENASVEVQAGAGFAQSSQGSMKEESPTIIFDLVG